MKQGSRWIPVALKAGIAANIYLEWGQFDEAAGLLLQSIGICEKHLEITAYARRQRDLLEHLAEVYHFGRHPNYERLLPPQITFLLRRFHTLCKM